MIIPVLIGVVIVLAILLLIVAMQPADFRVSRSAPVAGPPESVFALVNDLHRWASWSPWEGIDPAMKRQYEGPEAGPGAVYHWTGNKKVGEGIMTVTESLLNELIRLRLEFLKPFRGTNATEFTFKPEGGRTIVTWTMSGKNPFIAKAMHLFVNMDRMIGSQFEKGLANLNAVVTGKPAGAQG